MTCAVDTLSGQIKLVKHFIDTIHLSGESQSVNFFPTQLQSPIDGWLISFERVILIYFFNICIVCNCTVLCDLTLLFLYLLMFILFVTVPFFRKMSELENISHHIGDRISTLRRMLDLSVVGMVQ